MTKLAFLMKKLGITDKKLGEYLNVDKSLVNKWKNGKRDLPSNSPYIFEIAEAMKQFFLGFDYEEKQNFKKDFPFPFEIKNPKAHFLSFLKNNAIRESDLTEISGASSTVNSIVGGDFENYKGSYSLFFEKIKHRRKGTLYCFLSGKENYDCEDILHILYINFLDLISRDNDIEVIFDSFGIDAEMTPVLYFADLFFNNKFKLNIKKSKSMPRVLQSFFVYEKDIALEMNYVCEGKDYYYSEIFADSVRCEFTHARFIGERLDSFPFCDKMSKKGHRSVYSLFQEHSIKSSSSYFYLDLPLFFELPTEVIREVLIDSKIKPQVTELILRRFSNVYLLSSQPSYSHKVRMIFSMESFDKLINYTDYFIFSLSMFCEENVTISRKNLIRLLREWVAAVRENNRIELILTPQPLMHGQLSYYIKKYYYAIMWRNLPGSTEVLFTEDSYNTQLLYSIIDDEWSKMKVCIRDKNQVLEYIESIVEWLGETL